MMKGIVILLIVAIGGLVIFYYAGGYGSHDPTQQGKDALAAIEAAIQKGPTTWKDVIRIARDPQEVRYVVIRERNGEKIPELGGRNDNFDSQLMADDIRNNVAQHGFQFTYRYSGSMWFTVDFDGKGNAESASAQMTPANLFNP